MNLFLALRCRGGTVRCLREVRNQVQCVNNPLKYSLRARGRGCIMFSFLGNLVKGRHVAFKLVGILGWALC